MFFPFMSGAVFIRWYRVGRDMASHLDLFAFYELCQHRLFTSISEVCYYKYHTTTVINSIMILYQELRNLFVSLSDTYCYFEVSRIVRMLFGRLPAYCVVALDLAHHIHCCYVFTPSRAGGQALYRDRDVRTPINVESSYSIVCKKYSAVRPSYYIKAS